MAKYKRILLKLSGEALAGDKKTGFDEETCVAVAKQVKKIVEQGAQVAIVIGGGNFWRGRTSNKIDRPKADGIGMLATIMNCMYVSEIFRTEGMSTNIYTPFLCGTWTKLFSKDDAVADLQAGKVVFFAGGTGHPYFSTDMSMVLRAIEIEADCILGAKAVDGVYDSDPAKNPNAKKIDDLSLSKIVDERLGVIDLAASVLAMENSMPMLLFGLNEPNSIERAVAGENIGTLVHN